MDVHEYQAKELLAQFGVATPKGAVAYSPEQAVYCATELGGWHWAVKAQIHSGGRGKAGGVKLCKTYHEVRAAAAELLGKRLVTNQTGPRRQVGAARLYRGRRTVRARDLPRLRSRPESRARPGHRIALRRHGYRGDRQNHPEEILQVVVEPAVGLQAFEAREIAFGLGLTLKQVQPGRRHHPGAYRAFRDLDATMVEINPLVVTKDDRVLALDAKMSFDDNALFRRHTVADMRDHSQEDPREVQAAEHNLNYVGLDGKIGCIVNGAGLAMATMDMIKYAGGSPANFLDVGGGASPERVAAAFRWCCPTGTCGRFSSMCSPASIVAIGWRRRRQGLRQKWMWMFRWWCVFPAPMSRPGAISSQKAVSS